ncbi:hypothetical protein ACV1EB_21490, partial [Aeromonas caviae]
WRGQRPTSAITVAGGRSCIQNQAVASCPDGTTLVGGGFQIANQIKSGGTNSPDVSRPLNSKSWVVVAGGYPDYCFDAYAICAQ